MKKYEIDPHRAMRYTGPSTEQKQPGKEDISTLQHGQLVAHFQDSKAPGDMLWVSTLEDENKFTVSVADLEPA